MTIPLIIVTPDRRFGDLIRRNLEDPKRFTFQVIETMEGADDLLRGMECTIAFLDTAFQDDDLLRAGHLLQQANPKVRFIIASGTGWHAALEDLHPVGYISKPFHLPDLMAAMDKLYPSEKQKTIPATRAGSPVLPAGDAEAPWLADVTRAAQHLTRLTLESSAQAALITRNDHLWAYAGQLPQSAASELAKAVARYRDRRGESDLLRFIKLTSTNAEHMLYATRLGGKMMLALIFDAETPFSTIRSQAGNLVRSLATEPVVDAPAREEPPIEEEEPELEVIPSLADIIKDIPLPNPPWRPTPLHEKTASPHSVRSDRSLQNRRDPIPNFDLARVILEYEQEQPQVEIRPARPEILPLIDTEALDEEKPPEAPPSVGKVRKIVLEPVSPSVYNLTYACLLVPRFPNHLLVGDLADRLAEWVPQVCIAFGWRLEHISVHPDYLQWIANVPPATSPGYLMRILRQHTSERVFTEYPGFSRENPSRDFWAPGYLIVGGTQSPPNQLIREFINQTRLRQGITGSPEQ